MSSGNGPSDPRMADLGPAETSRELASDLRARLAYAVMSYSTPGDTAKKARELESMLNETVRELLALAEAVDKPKRN